MADLSYRVNLANPGHYSFTMPEGFDDKVEVHLWGAGGGAGAGGAAGGAGGYVKSIVTISAGDTVDIGVGGAGVSAASINTAGAGGVSMTSKYRGGSGGGRGSWCGNVNGPMASAGGGGATAIDVNGTAAAVAGGGGGGGGYGHKGAKYGGYAAGVYTDWVMSNTNGGNATWGGGGGGGYLGGSSGYASGHAVIGGNGGTNFGTLAVTGLDPSSILAGARLVYNVPTTAGGAGFNGYAIIIFTRKNSLLWKQSNGNVRVTLSNSATITAGSIIQQEYSESIQGNAIVKQGTSGGNTIIVSYLDSNVFVADSGNIASSPWTGNLILPGDIDANVYPTTTTSLGDWVTVANVYYKTTTSGVLNNLSSGEPTTTSFTRAGTYTFTVPSNVKLLTVRASGGGGGGGGYDSNGGASGLGGSLITGRIEVTPGTTYTVVVGQGGRGGAGGVGNAAGGAGGDGGPLGGAGGAGSNSGPTPWSGAGGGGGGASGVLSVSAPLVVAGGGGGGGGGGNHSGGQGVYPGGTSASTVGGAGAAKGGDGGGAGGGGGGYPLGGAGGAIQGGDNGGYSGATGQSYAPDTPGYSLIVNGGSIGGAPNGNPGADGFVEISYNVYYYLPGTWVPVESVYYKLDGEWQNLVSSNIPAITKIG